MNKFFFMWGDPANSVTASTNHSVELWLPKKTHWPHEKEQLISHFFHILTF